MTTKGKRHAWLTAALVATGLVGASPAQAGLLSSVVHTATTAVGNTTTTVTSTVGAAGSGNVSNVITTATTGAQTTVGNAASNVTTTAQPVTQPVLATATAGANTATSIIEPITAAAGSTVAGATTLVSGTTSSVVGTVVNEGTTQQLNVIPSDYDPITPIGQLLGGTAGLGNVLQGVTCKPLGEVQELLNESPVVAGLTSLACNASILDYKFFTQFKKADGSMITRSFTAQLGVPTLLDVDEDATPDFIGTLTFTGLNSIGLTVERVAGEAAQEPVSIEAVISDTTGSLLGRRELAVGYDARDDRAPGRFVLSTPLDTILNPSPTVTASLAQTDRGEKIALLASAFDGTPEARVNPAELRLHYDASPNAATITANVGQAVSVSTTNDRTGPAQLTGRIVDGADQTKFHAEFVDLPTALNLTANTSGALSAVYNASAPVARLTAGFEQLHGSTLEQKAILDLTGVPTGLAFSQDGEGGEVHTTGGPLGLAKIGIANGEPEFLTDDAYAYLKSDASGFRSTAIQIPGIEDATFSLGDVPRISATIQATKFRVLAVDPDRRIEARIDRLPHRFDVSLDLSNGIFDYDGHGDRIDSIALSADQATPLFGRATKVRGTIEGIPARTTVSFSGDPEDGGVEVTPDPIDKVELLASNGAEESVPGTGQGVVYKDQSAGDYLIAARILKLKKIGLATVPNLQLQAITQGGPFTLSALTDDLQADGEVLDLPHDTTIGLTTGDHTAVSFTGKDDGGNNVGIEHLNLRARALNGPLFGAADHVEARIDGIPSPEVVSLDTSDGGVTVEASQAIDRIRLAAANRAIDFDADQPAGSNQAIHFIDQGAEYVASARILGFKKIAASIGDAIGLYAETAGGLFTADLATDTLTANARIADLPAKTTVNANLGGGTFSFKGRNADDSDAPVGTVDVDVASTQDLFGRARFVNGHIAGIPADLNLNFAENGDGVGVNADQPIGLIEIAAASRAIDPATDLPAADRAGVTYVDHAGGDFVIGARVRQFKTARVSTGTPVKLRTEVEGGPFYVNLDTDPLRAKVEVHDLPSVLTATLDLDAGSLDVANSAPIGQILADADSTDALFGRAKHVHADIRDIPQNISLNFAQNGEGVGVTADQAIGSIEVVASSDPITDPQALLPASNEMGARYVDKAAEPFVLSARVRQFKKARVNTGMPLRVATQTESGPFDIQFATDDLDAHARIEDLPSSLTASLDLDGGALNVDNSAPLNRILIDADSATALFGRAKHFHGDVRGIPAQFNVDFAENGEGVGVTADKPIQSIELAASSAPITDPAALLPAGNEMGVKYVDKVAQPFVIGARVREFEKARVNTGMPITIATKTESGPFDVEFATDDLSAHARVEDLPAQLNASLNLDAGSLVVNNSSALDRVLVDAHSTTALFGRAKYVHADVKQIPAAFSIDFAENGEGIGLDGTEPIGSIEVAAANHPFDATTDLPASNEQGVIFTDRSGADYVLGARVRQLKKARVSTGTPIRISTETESGPFSLAVDTDDLVATGRIEDLPAKLSATLNLDEGQLAVNNSAPLDRIFLNAHSTSPLFGRATFVHADIRDIPAAFTVDFAENGDGMGVSTDDPIGSIEVSAANRPLTGADLPASGEQGIRYTDLSGGDYAIGARVLELRKARFTTSSPIRLGIETAGGPFSAHVNTDDLTADARIEDLPAKLNGTIDLDNGTFALSGKKANGDDTGIDRVLVDAHSATQLFGRATDVHAEIKGIPANLTLNLAQGDNGVDLTASDPIDSIEVVAKNAAITDPATDLPPAGEQGASFTDLTNGDFLLAARLLKLKHLGADISDNVHINAITAGGRFTLHARTDDLTGNAVIDELPAKLDALVDLDAGKLTVSGRDADDNLQAIDSIHVDLASATEVFGRAKNIVADITDIPGDMDLDIAQDAAGVRLDAHDNPIGSLQVVASDSPVNPADVLPAGMGAVYHDTASQFLLAARINQLKLVNVSLSDNIDLTLKTAGGPFDIDVDTDDLDATGFLHDLPDSVQMGLNPDSGELSYTGSDAIEDVYLAVSSPEPFFANARRFSLAIKHLVQSISLNLAASGAGGGIVNNTPDPIESIELLASSDPAPQPFPSVIPDGEQGAVYHDTTGDFLLAARLLDLRSLTFSLAGDSVGLNANLRSTPFTVDLDAEGITAMARIDKLPAKTGLNFDLANGHVGYTGKDQNDNPVGLDSITFNATAPASAPLFGAARVLKAKILNVPPVIDVGFDQENGAADVSTTGGAIGELSFLASSDPAADYRATQGLTFRDITPTSDPREFNLSAKILGLQHLTAGLQGLGGDDPATPEVESGSILLDAQTAGGLFDLDIASDAFSAVGTIDQLPPSARVEANLGDGQVSFNGSAAINRLHLAATSNEAIFGRADNLDVDIHGLPQSVTLGIAQSDDPAVTNTGASLIATDADGNPVTITSVEVAAWKSATGKQMPATGDQGVIFIDKDDDADETNGSNGDYAIGARINQLQSLVADFGDALNLTTRTAGGPFRAHIETSAFGGDVAILNLPSQFNLVANLGDTAVPQDSGPAIDPGTISYSGNATIGQLTADVTSDTPLIGDANQFKVDLQGLPASAAIGVAPDSGKLSLNAGGGQIDKVELFAKDAASSFPSVPGPATGDGAFLDDTDGHFRLAARIYSLQLVEVTLDPIALHTKVGGISRPFNADIKLAPAADAAPGTDPIHATLGVINLPTELTVGISDLPSTVPDPANPGQFLSGGSKLSMQSTSNVSQLTINADGLELLPGAEGVGADIRGVPKTFSLTLPDTEVVPNQPLATLAVDPGQQIDELRLAAGGVTLTSAGMLSGGSTDQFIYYGNEANFGVGVKLTGVKGLSMNLDPVNLSIDQNQSTTKPINIDAKLPQDPVNGVAQPDSIITGLMNKPTAHTEIGVDLTPGQPTQLNLRNGAVGTPVSPGNANQTMASLTLSLQNLGTIPSASFSLTKVPQIMKACLATDGNCIRTDSAHATTAFSTWQPSSSCTAKPQVPGNFPTGKSPAGFRPYNPQTSLYFDDQNTSVFNDGPNSAANRSIANMVTMNANIALSTGPVVINNLRFHNLSLDFADSGTNFPYKPIVSITAGNVPRIYLYIDSQKYPFVMNDVRVPPSVPKMVMGTDSNPARAFKRIAWIPGARTSFLCGTNQSVDTQAQQSLDCGGAKELQIQTSLGQLNAFNLPIFGDALNICGGTVPTS